MLELADTSQCQLLYLSILRMWGNEPKHDLALLCEVMSSKNQTCKN